VADADDVVMVTWANWHYQDFVRNWVDHVRAANISSFLVRPARRTLPLPGLTLAMHYFRDAVLQCGQSVLSTCSPCLLHCLITSAQVGAMDDKLLEALASDGVGAFSMDSGLTTGDFGWGSATFHKMVTVLTLLPCGETPVQL
jgi:arabinosyltransferase